jgi:hypothetical protein
MSINSRALSISRRLFPLLLASLIIASCAKKLEDDILGKWRNVNDSDTVELLNDGTIMIVNRPGPMIGGRYTFVDKDRIKVELGGMASVVGPLLVTVSIQDDELSWTMPDGSSLKYRREE